MTDRLARSLVRLYPRAWRRRYEHEFVALLDDSVISWRVVIDVALGACVERVRHAARVAIGHTAETAFGPSPSDLVCAIAAVLISAAGWLSGRLLNSFVVDGWASLIGVLLFLVGYLELSEQSRRSPVLPPGPPTYVAHPFQPGVLVRLRRPPWIPRLPKLPAVPYQLAVPLATVSLAAAWFLSAASPDPRAARNLIAEVLPPLFCIMITIHWFLLAVAPRMYISVPPPPVDVPKHPLRLSE